MHHLNRAQWFPYYRREIFSEYFREKHFAELSSPKISLR